MANFKFDYISAAEKMVEKGDYESALHYYFLARNLCRDNDIDVCIGDTYAAMGLIKEAIRFYMRVFASDNRNEDALNGLISCFKDIDEDAAYYYLHLALLNGGEADDFDFGDEIEEFAPPLTVHDRRDKSEAMDKAFSLLERGDEGGAVEILKSIDKESYQYCDSVMARASLEMDKSNGAEAIQIADEALAVNPNHVGTHILKIMAYDALGDKENARLWIKKLDEIDPKDEDGVTKAALCLSTYNHELAEKYILRKLEFTPYEKLMLLCLCSIQAAKGDMQAAYKTAGRVCAIYPDDIEAKEITSRILDGNTVVKLPDEIIKLKQEWTRDIKNLFLEDVDKVTEPEKIRRIKWLLTGDDDLYLQSAVCAFVTGMPEFNSMIEDLLIDPFSAPIVKKQILLRLVCDEKTKKINFVISNVFRSLKVRHPKVADNLKYAYYYVFIALAVGELNFEKKLATEFKKLCSKFDACSQKEDLAMSTLAAVLYHMITGVPSDTCCEYFDCEKAAFEHAETALDLQRRK